MSPGKSILTEALSLNLTCSKKTRATPYHPQGDGQIERFNRTLKYILNKYVGKHPRDWDVYLPLLMLAYRYSINESTGETPSLFMLGREVELSIDLLYGRQDTKNTPNDSYSVNALNF